MPTTLPEIVEDIIKNMSEADKANVVDTPEEDLILFHDSWAWGSGTTTTSGRMKN